MLLDCSDLRAVQNLEIATTCCGLLQKDVACSDLGQQVGPPVKVGQQVGPPAKIYCLLKSENLGTA